MPWPNVGTENWADDLETATEEKATAAAELERLRAVQREDELEAAITVGPEGPPGVDGADGPSAYAVAVADGFVGDEAAWLASLVGVPGDPGVDGADGADGAPGAAGASIVWQGPWTAANAYALNDAVSNNDVSYVCVVAHTSSAAGAGGNEPGVGASWSTNWAIMTTSIPGATGPTGAAGADGKTLLNGSGVPSSGLGIDGDFYVDPTAQLIYGPKAAGAWPAGVNFKGATGTTGATGSTGAAGAAGKTVLNGTGAPAIGVGADGDFYYDTAAIVFYGPKASGAWPPGVSLLAVDSDLSPWVISGNLPSSVTLTGDSVSGVWTVLGALGATETLEG